jgi:hypothetical protein
VLPWLLLLLLHPLLHAQADVLPPVLVFEEPTSDLLTSERLQVRVRVVDESGIRVGSIRLQLDNVDLYHRWENGCLVLAEVSGLEEGWHLLRISAEDSAGNLGSATFRFRVFFPERSVEILSENLVVEEGKVRVSLLVHNPKAEVWEEEMRARLDGVENTFHVSVPPSGNQPLEIFLPAGSLRPGTYTLSVLRQTGENVGSRAVHLSREREFPFLLLVPVVAAAVLVLLKVRRKKPAPPEEVAGS